jgi:hypothetical protein
MDEALTENKKTLWWVMIEKDGKRFYLKNAPYFSTEKEAHDYAKQHNVKNYSLKSREENVDDDGRIVEANLGHNETSSIEQEGRFWIVTYQTANGTKEKSFESEDEARKFYNTLDEVFKPKSSFDDYSIGDNVTVAGKKAKITNMKMDDETGERRARVRFEDGTAEEVSINSLNELQELDEYTVRRWQHYAGIK